jgi:hypothetical protein
MCEVAYTRKMLNLFTGFLNRCLKEETVAVNISIERPKTLGCGGRFHSKIVRVKRFLSLLCFARRDNERQSVNVL